MAVSYDQGRFELKYAVPVTVLPRILEVAGEHMVPDSHGTPLAGGGLGYVVHSTYYDTDDLIDYTSRLCDQRVRRRMRVRTYGAPGQRQPVFLENKRKLDNQVIKQRALVSDADEWKTLGDMPWEVLAECMYRTVDGRAKGQTLGDCPWEILVGRHTSEPRAVAARFGAIVRDLGLRPVTSVHYEREVYCDVRANDQYGPDGQLICRKDGAQSKVRLTFDRKLSASVRPPVNDLYPEPEIDLIPPDWAVLELKFDRDQPGWMRTLVRELGLRAEPVSKFGLSVALGLRAKHPREIHRMTPSTIRKAASCSQ